MPVIELPSSRNRSRPRIWRLLLILILVVFGGLAALPLLTVSLTYCAYYLSAKNFDPDGWKADTNFQFRLSMANSLLRDRDLKAMTYGQIIDLLGTPENIASGTTSHPDWDLEYLLGPGPGFRPNLEFLVIRVKPGQRATAAAILTEDLDL